MERNLRRRKQQLRRRRRILRRIARDIVLLLMLLALIGVICLFAKLVRWITKSGDDTQPYKVEIQTEEMISGEEMLGLTEKLYSKGYPESLIELLELHPETKEFVVNYEKNKDKKFEIDLSDEVLCGKIPLFLQWDERWGYERYGNDFIAVTGCGPTCLSMVRCGISGDTEWNPLEVAKMAEANGFYVEGEGSSWDLMTLGASQIGLTAYSVSYDADSILLELYNGNPIICVVGQGDFTTTGHFIVLVGADENGNVTVRDPNSKTNSRKTWHIDDLMPQIRNLWGYALS
ncbi:MAG: C39 family peptidase [Lachnospiraceae bacterium]|nr:C39 family peptidase [Lachnospiraceae bacterium]